SRRTTPTRTGATSCRPATRSPPSSSATSATSAARRATESVLLPGTEGERVVDLGRDLPERPHGVDEAGRVHAPELDAVDPGGSAVHRAVVAHVHLRLVAALD